MHHLRLGLLALALSTLGALGLNATSAPQDREAEAAVTDDEESSRPAVLVTGASSGIGRRTTEVLAANGFFVYAGARKDADLAELNALENVQGIRLDVTDPEQIAAAVATVEAGGRGLFGLINNAGVAVVAPLIEVTDADLEFQFDVNVKGPVRVTRAFADLLIASGGRMATTGSISGFLAWEFGGPYTMSKHAIESFSDTLAAELAPFGVAVGVVDPGNYRSQIGVSMRERLQARGYATEGSRYAEQMEARLSGPGDRDQYDEPDDVAAAFLAFLTDEAPRRRTIVTPNRAEAEMTLRAAIARVAEIASGPQEVFGEDEVLEMVKAALDGAR
ncbi:Cyclopentanol dehydrogenase [Planctomycetes bacterium Pla163]|uniref:Cyclopentanol dehydrogenase n=1 Tax=Rohdeia mirabilis TaxID=2528008 RepID=A0A518CWD0_9BACT|nr:Cyclopentanol dehydrogenase [Planctomycetes bacterium Pla163]